MRFWQIEAVLYDYAPHAGKATVFVNVEAEDGSTALATAMSLLAPRAFGAHFTVTEQLEPASRWHGPDQ